MIENKEIFRSIIERDISNTYNNLKILVFNMLPGGYKKIAANIINANEPKIIAKLQDYCDMLVETSCADPDISLEDAIQNANDTINELINSFITEKLDLPPYIVSIMLHGLFGGNI